MAWEGRRGSSLRAGKNFILTIIGTNERVLSKDMFTNFALTVLYKIYSTIAMTKRAKQVSLQESRQKTAMAQTGVEA